MGIVPGGFEPPSMAPKAIMIGHYTTGLQVWLTGGHSSTLLSPARVAPFAPLTPLLSPVEPRLEVLAARATTEVIQGRVDAGGLALSGDDVAALDVFDREVRGANRRV